jgi:hypothetical protein
MNNQEAKFILGGYRPGGRDAADPMFADALRQAERDPALGAWFARAQAHDAAVAGKLAQVTPPAGLREAILAGSRVSGAKRAGWRQPAWLAMAAAAAVMVGAVAFWPKRADAKADPVATFALVDALEGEKHGGHGAAVESLVAELHDPATRLSEALPVNFTQLHNTGCRTVNVTGRSVLEVCFERNGQWFHCYIAKCDDFPELRKSEEPVFVANGQVNAVAWADGTHHFVVAGAASREAIARLL